MPWNTTSRLERFHGSPALMWGAPSSVQILTAIASLARGTQASAVCDCSFSRTKTKGAPGLIVTYSCASFLPVHPVMSVPLAWRRSSITP